MEQNKTGKYIKYAMGEIVLVVIGILIALSINNWNNARIVNQKELSFLIKLKDEINNNMIRTKRLDSLTGLYISNFEEPLENFYQINP